MTLTGCLWSSTLYLRRVRASCTATLPVSPVRTVMAAGNSRVSPLAMSTELLDDQGNGQGADSEQDDHGRADHHQADQVFGEVGHAVERDRRIRGLDNEAAAASLPDLVAPTERHLDGPHERLVAADSGLGHAARRRGGLCAGARRGRAGQGAGRAHRLAEFAFGSLLALATHRSASLDGDAHAARFAVRGWHIWPLRPAPPATSP